MLTEITGLHHVTALAASAGANNAFFTRVLGLRRVKKTVNFDAPQVYHLYYGDEIGRPGTVMTSFPFPRAARGRRGTGEAGLISFSVPPGTLEDWTGRLAGLGVAGIAEDRLFGAARLSFDGPDGERLALVEAEDARAPWTGGGVEAAMAIRGLHGAQLTLADAGATAELLRVMGYAETGREGEVRRFALTRHNGAGVIDLAERPGGAPARQGAGSVHHIAFAVPDRAGQDRVRAALTAAGYRVTPVIDRDYFRAIYFRSPGGVLFEVATDAPGFACDEEVALLGRGLRLPAQHAHLRAALLRDLEALPD
jgi:glyoxalase family protein